MGLYEELRIWSHVCVSTVVTSCFLACMFVAALWHNFSAIHLGKATASLDHRDTSHPKTLIRAKSTSRTTLLTPNTSVRSTEPYLDIEYDEDNNIEYDHRRTYQGGRRTGSESSPFSQGSSFSKSSANNPFLDLLAAEDTKLVPELSYYYKQYGIEIDEHEIVTEDGFILDLWHFRPPAETVKRPPALLLHGLLQSCGSFASSGRKSLAYYLYNSGYDVWLGNNRCGFKANVKPRSSQTKWEWGMHEMVRYDLKAMIESVLDATGFERLTLLAHSQGTTQAFMGLVNGEKVYADTDFRLQDKLEHFVALAPAVYPGSLLQEKLFVRYMAKTIDSPWVFGSQSFLPIMMVVRSLFVGTQIFSFICYIFFNYMFDWNDALWDAPLRNRHFMFSPVHISVKLMQWWLSNDSSKQSFKNNSENFFPDNQSWFPVSSSTYPSNDSSFSKTPKILLFVPKQDRLVDGERLINHFVEKEDHSLYKIWYIDEYSHLDILWASDVIERVGRPILETIQPS